MKELTLLENASADLFENWIGGSSLLENETYQLRMKKVSKDEYRKMAKDRAKKAGLLKGYLGPFLLGFLLSPLFGAIWGLSRYSNNKDAIDQSEADIAFQIKKDPQASKLAKEIAKNIKDEAEPEIIKSQLKELRRYLRNK